MKKLSSAKKSSKISRLAVVFGQVIARRREELGMEQVELASQLAVTQATVSRIESGQSVTIDQLWTLARVLGLSPSELVARVEQAVGALTKSHVRVVGKRENAGSGELLTAAVVGGLLGFLLSSSSDE